MAQPVSEIVRIQCPERAKALLGQSAPAALPALGDVGILARHKLGVIGSLQCPATVILATHDLARAWATNGEAVIGGFHSPVEKECLRLLLRGTGPVVICPARGLEGMRVPAAWWEPIGQGRLLLLSPFDARCKRATADLAEQRNRFVAALADAVFVPHASPGRKTESLCRQVVAWGKPLWTVAGPENANLLALGAKVAGQGAGPTDTGSFVGVSPLPRYRP